MPYSLSKRAERDIEDILVEGILRFGEYQASRYQASLFRTFELLAEIPLMGRVREPARPNARRFLHNTHVIFYSVGVDGVLIETIIYGPLIRDVWGDS